MDKESLKKNHFWYLFGGVMVVIVVVLICVLVGGSTEAATKKDALAKGKKAVADAKAPKNDKFIQPWNQAKGEYADVKDKVWEKAWKAQEAFYVWPEADGIAKDLLDSKGQQIDYNKLMLYAADTKDLELRVRERYAEVYPLQFANTKGKDKSSLKDLVTPAIFGRDDTEFATIMAPTLATASSTIGAPQGRGSGAGRGDYTATTTGPQGSGTSYLTVVGREKAEQVKGPPTPEEIWLLQEDLWVKRELLNILHTVQQNAARFKPVEVKADEPRPDGVQKDAVIHRFTNGTLEFTLYVENKGNGSVLSPKSTLKNVSPDQAVQVVSEARGTKELEFNLVKVNKEGVKVKNGPTVTFTVGGEPLAYNQSMPLTSLPERVDNLDLSQDFGLEQKFDWSNAPIRRIDALVTAKQSHRTAIGALNPNPIFKSKDEAAGPGGPGGPGAPGGQPGAPTPGGQPTAQMPAASGGTGERGGFGGPGAANSDATPYGLERDRYIFATEYARHLPIAMDLVVEPAYIDDLLVAIANSPLRIQATQVAFQKLARVSPPPEPGADTTTPTETPMRPRSGSPERTTRPPTTIPKTGPNGQTLPGADDPNGDTNLVELTVYGIATLYERPKPKDASPKPGTPPVNQPGGGTKPNPMTTKQ
jgi:hypothetical protein